MSRGFAVAQFAISNDVETQKLRVLDDKQKFASRNFSGYTDMIILVKTENLPSKTLFFNRLEIFNHVDAQVCTLNLFDCKSYIDNI